jgi:hypothetical protein
VNPLNSSNVDSQGIKYNLNSSNSTATIANQSFNTGHNSGQFSYLVGRSFMIQSVLNPYLYVDSVYGVDDRNIHVWHEDGDTTFNRIWTIDENGRLICIAYPGLCCYITSVAADESDDARVVMKNISSLSVTDEKQYWGFDGVHIYLSSQPTKYWDLASGNHEVGTKIALRNGEYSGDNRRKWRITPVFRYTQYNTLTFKRGVVGTGGKIYKLNNMTNDSLTYNINYSTIVFPQHKIVDLNKVSSGFPLNLSAVHFKDGIYYLNIVNTESYVTIHSDRYIISGSTTHKTNLTLTGSKNIDNFIILYNDFGGGIPIIQFTVKDLSLVAPPNCSCMVAGCTSSSKTTDVHMTIDGINLFNSDNHPGFNTQNSETGTETWNLVLSTNSIGEITFKSNSMSHPAIDYDVITTIDPSCSCVEAILNGVDVTSNVVNVLNCTADPNVHNRNEFYIKLIRNW